MSNSSADRNTQISKEALRLLGIDALFTIGGRIFPVVIGPLQVHKIKDCIQYLIDKTGPGGEIDPYVLPDGNAWINVQQILSQIGLGTLALQVASKYLKFCYELQKEDNQRIKKGAPLFWLAQRFLETGDKSTARGYMLLAFIEDTYAYSDLDKIPAYQQLVEIFDFAPGILKDLRNFTQHKFGELPKFPEEVLVEWELARLPFLGRRTKGKMKE